MPGSARVRARLYILLITRYLGMMATKIRLRQSRSTDRDTLLEIYREGFRSELSFFFRRFCRCFFAALFDHLAKDTIVAEADDKVVGFVIVIDGAIPIMRASFLRLVSAVPVLLTVVKRSFLAFLFHRAKNIDWRSSQVGIACIAVKSHFQRKGIGRALMREALARYPGREVILDVRPWNSAAIRLYSGAGFIRIGVWRDPLGEWTMMSHSPLLHTRDRTKDRAVPGALVES